MAATRKIKSDVTLLRIIEALQQSEGVGVTELAESIGIAKSTTHAHLSVLEDWGYAVKSDGKYHLGLRFLKHGIVARNRQKFFKHAKPVVDNLARETDEKAWCITEENGKAVYLYGAVGDSSVKTWAVTGEVMDIHSLAAGKAILASMTPERREEILQNVTLSQYTEYTIADREKLDRELERIEEQGVAYNFEESVTGLNAIGAAVVSDDGFVHGAISVSGPANRLTKEKMEGEIADRLLGSVNEIEMNTRFS